MIISDLSYLQTIFELGEIVGGATAAVGTSGTASGDSTYTNAKTSSFAKQLSNGSVVAVAVGRSIAIASDDSNDASATTSTSGSAEGDIDQVFSVNRTVDLGPFALSISVGVAVAVDVA
ncbi:MAG: hypothetical protein ACRDEA_11840 [Microcystaceae cyanobacterium]